MELRDSDGNSYDVALRWSPRRLREVYLTKGWNKFARDNNLKGGSVVRLSVSTDNEAVIDARVVNV